MTSLQTTILGKLLKVAAGFVPWRVPPTKFTPTSIQLDQVRPQPDQVTYRDYSSFFYPLRF